MYQVNFNNWDCIIKCSNYGNGRTAILLVDTVNESPVAKATINIPHASLDFDEVFIKNWAENDGMIDCLFESEIIEEVSGKIPTGHVFAHKCRLTRDFMTEYNIKDTRQLVGQ